MENPKFSRQQFLQEGPRLALTALKTAAALALLNRFGTEVLFGSADILYNLGAYQLPKDYHELSTVKLEQGVVTGLGVAHSYANFLEHRDQVRARIEKSDATILEYFTPSIRELAKPDITDQQLEDSVTSYNSMAGAFFSAIGRECADAGRDIFVVNPQSAANLSIDTTLITYILYDVLAGSRYTPKLLKKAIETPLNKGKTRRVLVGASSLLMLSWLGATNYPREILDTNDDSGPEKARLISWDLNDFRDIKTAMGIEKVMDILSAEVPDPTVDVIQGAFHKGYIEYLKSPDLRQKIAMYPLHEKLGNNTINRFRFNKEENQWDQILAVGY